MTEITSSSNSHFKIWRSLLNSKGIKSEGLFILSGEKLIREFLKSPNFEIVAELLLDKHFPVQSHAPIFVLKKDLFNELDSVGTHFNLLILKTKTLPESHVNEPIQDSEVIIPVGDPNNLGALIRSCVAFGVAKIHLTTESAHPFHPKVVKASAGAALKAPLFTAGSLLEWDDQSVFALDAQGENIQKMTKPKPFRLMVGEEGPGLPKNLKNVKWVSIPIQNVESLNATVAASLVLWSWS